MFLFTAAALTAVLAAAPDQVPTAPAPQEASRPAPDGASLPLPVTRELLERWDIKPEAYLALAEEEKRRIQKELTLGELGRLRQLHILQVAAGERWRGYVTEKGWPTPEGLRLIQEHEARLAQGGFLVPATAEVARQDGSPLSPQDAERVRSAMDRLFDGIQQQKMGVAAGDELVWDARFRNETLYRLRATNPKTGWSFEVGQLGVDGRHRVLDRSWYANIRKEADSDPDHWVDYRIKTQLGIVDLRARFFDDNRHDPGVDRAFDLARKLGVSEGRLSPLQHRLQYDDAYKAQTIVVGSLLFQLGRAYNLFGPVDVAWAVTNITKVAFLAPNTAFDESAGLRIRLGPQGRGPFLGVFGGVTQNVSPVGNNLLQQAFNRGEVDTGLYVEQASHAHATLWGQVPGISDASYSVTVGQRWNQDTTVRQAEAALMTTFLDKPLALRASYSQEQGEGIEFDRRKARLQAEVQLSDKVSAYAAYEKDDIRYGNATLQSEAFLAGFEATFDPRHTVTLDHVFGGRYRSDSAMRPHMEQVLSAANRFAAQGVETIDAAQRAYDAVRADLDPASWESHLNELSSALNRLPAESLPPLLEELSRKLNPDQARYLSHILLKTVSPSNQHYERLRGWIETSLAPGGPAERLHADIDHILQQLSDPALSAEARQRLLLTLDGLRRRAAPAASRVLERIDDASAFYDEHKADVQELVGLLTRQSVWESALVRAGRAALLQSLSSDKKITIPVLGDFQLDRSPALILAASHILNSRLSPLRPVKPGEIEPWLLKEAGESLGLKGPVTEDALVDRLFAVAGEEFKQYLSRELGPKLQGLLDGNTYDIGAVSARILQAVPPEARQALQARYGADLSRLLPPPGTSPAQVQAFLLQHLPDELVSFLHKELGGDMAKTLAQMVSWAGDLLAREVNMAVIHMLLAAEELDRLSADGGLKAPDHAVKMLVSSFEKLDARKQQDARHALHRAARIAAGEAQAQEERLAAKLEEYGRRRFEALTLDPSWPKHVTVTVPEKDWAPLLAYYGDGPLFAFLEKIKGRYAGGAGGPVEIELAFDPDSRFGSAGAGVWASKGGSRVRFTLPPLVGQKDPGYGPSRRPDPAFRLSTLEGSLPARR